MSQTQTLKDKGNALTKSGKWNEALAKYTQALSTVDASTPVDLQAILFTNRALCHLKLKELLSAESDCTSALDLPQVADSRAIKALFRRAQARSEMEPPRLASSLKDLKSVLSMDAANKAAQKLWQKLTERVRKQPAPVIAALNKIRLGPTATKGSTTDNNSTNDSNNNSTTDNSTGTGNASLFATDEENTKLLRWILGQTFDETEAKELVRKKVVERLWERIMKIGTDKDVDLLQHKDVGYALRALASMRNHESLSSRVCEVIGDVQEVTTEVWCWIIEHCTSEVLSSVLFCCEGLADAEANRRSQLMAAMVRRIQTAQDQRKTADSTSSSLSVVLTPILRGLVKWTIKDREVANEFTEIGGVKEVVRCADPVDSDVRGMVALCLGRVFSAYDDDNVVKERVRRDILPLLKPSEGALRNANGAAALLCVFMVNVSVGVWAVQSGKISSGEEKHAGSGETLQHLSQLALRGSALSQTMVVKILSHMVNDETGRATVAQDETMAILRLLMSCDTPSVRAGAAVAISKAKAVETKFGFKADSDEGKHLLLAVSKMLSEKLPKKQRQEELAMRIQGIEALSYLMTSTIAKESIVKSSPKSGENVLTSLVALAKDEELTSETSLTTTATASKKKNNNNKTKHSCGYGLACIFRDLTMSKQSKARDKLREMDVSEEQWEQFKKLTKSGNDNPLENDTPEMVSKRVQRVVEKGGIHALVALSASPNETSSMREALSQAMSNMAIVPSARGLMVQQGCLKPLVRLAGYGLDDKGNDIITMEKMKSERMNAQKREKRRKRREAEERGEVYVDNGDDDVGVSTAEQTAKNKQHISKNEEENVSSVLQGENSVDARRTKQNQGEATTRTRHLAGQALARILISTNPSMLPLSRVMDSIKPLLALVRTSKDNFMEYEGLMSLTNILSMSEEDGPKERFMTLRGIGAVEYAQFSSHPQVRTAATECFVNVVYHIEFVKYMLNNNGERFKLWISFAESFAEVDEEDSPTGYVSLF